LKLAVPAFDTGILSVARTEPMVPLLKAPLPGFVAIGNLLQAANKKSKTGMENIFFMMSCLVKDGLKTCPLLLRHPCPIHTPGRIIKLQQEVYFPQIRSGIAQFPLYIFCKINRIPFIMYMKEKITFLQTIFEKCITLRQLFARMLKD
jgi:hypothetical protein